MWSKALTSFAAAAISMSCLRAVVGRAQDERHVHGAALGAVDFPNSGAPVAQADFLRGLALLHNFEYDDAAAAFTAAEAKDPSFAMAYWLHALTYSHMLWSEEWVDSARAVLVRLGPDAPARLARARTAREQRFGAAIEAFFADGDQAARSRAFADSMRQVAAAYPADMEAKAFTALALLFASETTPSRGASNALSLEAAAYAERVFRARPDHPGAAHYMIHAYDDPSRAAKGLAAARAYAKIAPNAEHAQHMPSHIFVQLGLWDDAARSNEKAWASSRESVRMHHGTGADLDYHTLNWLQYVYLQQGRYAAARALIDTASTALATVDLSGYDNPDAKYAVSQLRFRYMRETGRWDALPLATFDTMELHLSSGSTARAQIMATNHVYETAVVHAMRGDTVPAALLVARARAVAAKRPGGRPGSPVTLAVFDALRLRARGGAGRDSAVKMLAAASILMDSLPPIGPVNLIPVHDLLGQTLLDAGRAREAVVAFQRSLAWAPNRSAPLLGLAHAAERAGDAATAKSAYARLRGNWAHADPSVRVVGNH